MAYNKIPLALAFDGNTGNTSGLVEFTLDLSNVGGVCIPVTPTEGQALVVSGTGAAADESCAGELHLFAPSSTTYVKQFYSTTSSYQHADGEYNLFVAGYIDTTSAITEIQFKVDSGTFDGTIALYGIT